MVNIEYCWEIHFNALKKKTSTKDSLLTVYNIFFPTG